MQYALLFMYIVFILLFVELLLMWNVVKHFTYKDLLNKSLIYVAVQSLAPFTLFSVELRYNQHRVIHLLDYYHDITSAHISQSLIN